MLHRKLDRQRRANNPDNHLPDGRVKPGPKRWVKSNRQRETAARLADLCRREAAHRRTLHGRLANRVLRAAAARGPLPRKSEKVP